MRWVWRLGPTHQRFGDGWAFVWFLVCGCARGSEPQLCRHLLPKREMLRTVFGSLRWRESWRLIMKLTTPGGEKHPKKCPCCFSNRSGLWMWNWFWNRHLLHCIQAPVEVRVLLTGTWTHCSRLQVRFRSWERKRCISQWIYNVWWRLGKGKQAA